jgi:hypothetical protein
LLWPNNIVWPACEFIQCCLECFPFYILFTEILNELFSY